MDIIFVITNNPYTGEPYLSYYDFWRLVDLSGFKKCQANEIDYGSDNIYILSFQDVAADYMNYPPEKRRCKFIYWQLERGDNTRTTFWDDVWVSDMYQARTWFKAKYVFLGGHKDFAPKIEEVKQFDFAHMSNEGNEGRRRKVWDKLKGYGYSIAPDPYGFEKYEWLGKSRIGLCMHQDLQLYIEPIRFVVFSCFKMPLLCEHSHDNSPYHVYDLESFLFSRNIDSLTNWQDNYRYVTEEMTFRKSVELALG